MKNIPEDELRKLFIEDKKTCSNIGKLYNCSSSTVSNYLKKYNILIDDRFLNQTFGKLKVINKGKTDKHGHIFWVCKCECGKIKEIVSHNLTGDKYGNSTKTCGCSRTTINSSHPNFSGYKEISGKLWYSLKRGAEIRNLNFSISIEYIWNLFIQQERKCKLTGLPISFAKSISRESERTASLDRIDSSLGYIYGNVQWIHKDVNFMKQDYSEDYLYYLCKLIVDRRNSN